MLKRKPRTANQLYMYFTKRYPNMPIVVVQDTIDRIITRRKEKGEARRENSRIRKQWQEILTPLQAHIQSVLVNQPMHKDSNPEYHKFNEKYLRLLRTLRDGMREHMMNGYYPKDSLNQYNIPFKNLEGVAWTWWIDKDIKRKVLERYAQLPRTPKTNYREIFPEPKPDTLPKVRQKLRDRIMSELTNAEMGMNSPHTSETGKEYYAQMLALLNEAMTRLEKLPRKQATPKTYEGLFTQAERHENYPLIYPSKGENA